MLLFADLGSCSEITATGCMIGAQNEDYVYRDKTGPNPFEVMADTNIRQFLRFIVASEVESTLKSLQTSNRPPTTLYFLVFCYAPAGISQHQKHLIVEFLHTSNVIGTGAKRMDDRRSIRAIDGGATLNWP